MLVPIFCNEFPVSSVKSIHLDLLLVVKMKIDGIENSLFEVASD